MKFLQKRRNLFFYIEVFYENDNEPIGSASGFFIDDSGIAVTNFHVIRGIYSAAITMTDGSKHKVEKVIGYDEEKDIAILKIEGSSGGALFNSKCQVIGITTGGISDGQNLNLAVPINTMKSVEQNLSKTIEEVQRECGYIGTSPIPDKVSDYKDLMVRLQLQNCLIVNRKRWMELQYQILCIN